MAEFSASPFGVSGKRAFRIFLLLSFVLLHSNGFAVNNAADSSAYRKAAVSIELPDMYYEYRIENLNKTSPIKLDFNKDVLKYINIFLKERPDKFERYMGLSELYFPIIESILDKYELPLELKYLTVVESGLDPSAVSKSGARGLWQLLYNSSTLLGLDVNSYTDQRCDPYLSTDAACRYLVYLYSIFNDWQLTLAAYNAGPGEVKNAIIRSGGKTDFWQLQPYLPEQTRWYVPAYIAVVYLFNHAADHGLITQKSAFDYQRTDTLMIDEAVEFSKISEKLSISMDTLRFLNPMYRRDCIPSAGKPLTLVLPSAKILEFLRIENQIYSRTNDTADYYDKLSNAGDTSGLRQVFYTVTKGDFLHKIALSFGCTIDNIIAWNSLKDNNVHIGQKLVVWLPQPTTDSHKTATQPPNQARFFYYTVKKGDTMWGIAERFNCDSIGALKAYNTVANENDLKPGMKLRIPVSE